MLHDQALWKSVLERLAWTPAGARLRDHPAAKVLATKSETVTDYAAAVQDVCALEKAWRNGPYREIKLDSNLGNREDKYDRLWMEGDVVVWHTRDSLKLWKVPKMGRVQLLMALHDRNLRSFALDCHRGVLCTSHDSFAYDGMIGYEPRIDHASILCLSIFVHMQDRKYVRC